ncbi:PspC domain-containing protein [Streptomyces sp. NPDC049954]|uniref:PspC domain-containing protein n=1 Tax=Streptomyces sp. NPDC049954 TaxID=3155779 RepID=UPI00341F9E64
MTDHRTGTPPPTRARGAGDTEPPVRGFRRDKRHKVLGGICAGLARRCDLDPVIFRIVLVVLSATAGVGLIFYGLVWLLVPYEEEEESDGRRLLTGRVDGPALTAVLCALVGCGLFVSMLNNGDLLFFAGVLALLTVGAGHWSRQRGAGVQDPAAAQAVADAPPETRAPPVADTPSWWRGPYAQGDIWVGEAPSPPVYLWGPGGLLSFEARYAGLAHGRKRPRIDPDAGSGEPDTGFLPPDWREQLARSSDGSHEGASPATEGEERRRPRRIGGLVFLLALVAGALGAGVGWADRPLGTSLVVGFSLALAVFGLGIAVSAFLGRLSAGSILLALVTTGLLIGASALPKDISGDWVRGDWRPTTVAQVRPVYSIGSGSGRLDLRGLAFGEDTVVRTRAEAGAGRLEVLVPPGTRVKLDVDVGLGDIQLPGERADRLEVTPGQERDVTLPPRAGAARTGTLVLRMHVGVGQAVVNRAP